MTRPLDTGEVPPGGQQVARGSFELLQHKSAESFEVLSIEGEIMIGKFSVRIQFAALDVSFVFRTQLPLPALLRS